MITTCAECRYWEQRPGSRAGRCRRSAPPALSVLVNAEGGEPKQYINAKWPSTFDSDGCGDGGQ